MSFKTIELVIFDFYRMIKAAKRTFSDVSRIWLLEKFDEDHVTIVLNFFPIWKQF
jgi:hypothetical protein